MKLNESMKLPDECRNVIVSGILFQAYIARNVADDTLRLVTKSALSEKEFYAIIGLKR